MLTRLLTNLDQIEACLLSGDGEIVGGEGKGDITLFHRSMKMASTLNVGRIDEMWFEGEATMVATAIRGGSSLWLTSDVLPVGRLSHEARTIRPVIEDLLEV